MAELTNSLVLLAKTEEDHNDMKMIEFPISDVARRRNVALRALARTQGKVLDSCIEAGVALCGDEKSLRRLMDILLDNAVKYCGEKGVIRVTLEKQKGFVKFSVFNTAELFQRTKRAAFSTDFTGATVHAIRRREAMGWDFP